jgi:23S rRNA (pseudouridine1915-N3)-methyltransferase
MENRIYASMKICLCSISSKRSSSASRLVELTQLYLNRAAHFAPCTYRVFSSEDKLLNHADEIATRTRPALILTDSRGQQLTSNEIAEAVGFYLDNGIQQLLLAIGPADGWSSTALARADKTIAFGRITLPHELAAVVAAEQLYRALTIRAGHPYHSGH